ncbi:MAG: nucleotidyltransferase domain-containing protein [Planctomycetota bacterium]
MGEPVFPTRSLSLPPRELLAQGRARLAKVFGARLHGVLLYGSHARGDAIADSDVDLMVVLNGPLNLGEDLRTIIETLYPLQLEIDNPIHVRPASRVNFEAGEFAIYRNAKREGIFL